MPRKSRKKVQPDFPATEPVALSDALAPIVEKHGLKPASQILTPLDPPDPLQQLTDARERKSLIDTPSQPEPPKKPDDTDITPSPERNGKHVAAVLAGRPHFRPVPSGFVNVSRHEAAGIRVNKSLDRNVAAIQFAEGHLPSRAEKDILEAINEPDDGRHFTWNTGSRQWERQAAGEMHHGDNIIDADRVARLIAKGRVEGQSR